MTHEEALVAAGAECVGGDLILNRQVVGQYRHGEFQITLAGAAVIEDMAQAHQEEILAVVKEASAEKPRRGRRPAQDSDPEVGDLK